MTTILYATRGGQGSYPNQDRAVSLAKERGATLVFLHVTNVDFLDKLASPILVDMETELDRMAEFLLAMAQERATNAQVESKGVIKRGGFRQALQEAIQENQADTVMFGSPGRDTAVLTRQFLEELAQSLAAESDLEILVLKQGEIISQLGGQT